jgi:hypothetical protein
MCKREQAPTLSSASLARIEEQPRMRTFAHRPRKRHVASGFRRTVVTACVGGEGANHPAWRATHVWFLLCRRNAG